MNYFEGEKIQVATTGGSTRISERYEISMKIAGEYGFVNEAKVVMNQQKGTNEREIKMDYVSTTEDGMNLFTCEVPFETLGIYYFCIKVMIDGEIKWIKYDKKHNRAFMTSENLPYWTVTVYAQDFYVPEWAKGKIMYQIFPDRFHKSENYIPQLIQGRVTKKWGELPNWAPEEDGEIHNNDYLMGNLRGIEEKLDYLEELGVEIIYLNPIALSQSNHRYDTADYKAVDPYLGTIEDFKNLCNSAHSRGMRIILDAVFNHTGNDSKYFNEYGNYDEIGAFQGQESPYYNWYKKDAKGNFEYWWNFKNLPVCDGNNSEWKDFICGENGVISYWLSLGADGIRLDVADELTDEFIECSRKAAKSQKQDSFIIGEVWDNAITKEKDGRQRTYLLGKGLDSVMNYPFTNAVLKYVRFGRADYLKETINEILTEYPKDAINSLMNSVSTHDITRAITTLVGDGIQDSRYNWVWDVPYSRRLQLQKEELAEDTYNKAKKLMKLATAIQYFLPGNPCIYYGDEAGMYGYRDPFNRRCFPWDSIDNELHSFFVELGKIRKQASFLTEAEMRIIEADEDVFVFERFSAKNPDERLIVAVNRSENEVAVAIPETYKNGETLLAVNASDGIISKFGIVIKSSK